MLARSRALVGDFVPQTATMPQHAVTPGEETIDGIRVEFIRSEGGETAVQLAVAIPEAGTIIVQDLVYNGLHPFVAEKRFSTWISLLEEYKQLPYEHVLPGHGPPGGKELYDSAIEYLAFAEQAVAAATSGEELSASLIERFPDLQGRSLLDIQNLFLFPAAEESED